MSFTLQRRTTAGVIVVACGGHMTLGEATSLFRDSLRDILRAGEKKIVLDLADVSYLDSSGVGELVGTYTSATNAGATVKLARLPRKVKDLLHLTRLITVFEVHDDEAAAVRSFLS
jgi:anti-sigma B factor antagonist